VGPAARTVGRWGAFGAYLALTFWLSSRPLATGSLVLPDWVFHALEFAGLSALLLRALGGRFAGPHGMGTLMGVLIFGVAYGALDELHQGLVPGRESSLRDALVDAAATTATVGVAAVIGSAGRRRTEARAPGSARR